jgi:hypothetical protein
MLIDTRYNLVTPLLCPLFTLNNQYRPPPCCLANIALIISLITNEVGGHTLFPGSYPLQSDGVVLAHILALQVVVAFHTQLVGEVGIQVVDLHMLELRVLHMHSEELHLLVSSVHSVTYDLHGGCG